MTAERLAGGSDPRRARIALAAWIALALALRLAFALLYWVGQPLTHDEREYLALGRSVARGDGFHYPADEHGPAPHSSSAARPGTRSSSRPSAPRSRWSTRRGGFKSRRRSSAR